MSRNNPERTGARESAEIPPEVGRSLEFVAPTEFVELPSRGKGYGEKHPLHKQEVIEIRFMTAKDEDILSSQTLIKKGLAIERFLQNIIVDKRIKSESILSGDRNAILIAARKSGYGAYYETKVTCPNCQESNDCVFDLENPEIQESVIDPELGITETSRGTFIVVPPLSKFKVELRLLTGREETLMAANLKNRQKKKQLESIVSDQLKMMIVSVEGHEDPKTINMYANNIPTQDTRHLRKAFKSISPNVRIAEDYNCTSCGFEQELEVPFGADFFWPDR